MDLTSIEKETIVLLNECEETAEIYTHNKKLINRIKKMCHQYPDKFLITREEKNGGVTCLLPKQRLSIVLTSPPSLANSSANAQRAKERNALGLNLAVV